MNIVKSIQCKPGDILFTDSFSDDGSVIIKKGTVLDTELIELMLESDIKLNTICTSTTESLMVSDFDISYSLHERKIKSFANKFVTEVLATKEVQDMYVGLDSDLIRHQKNVALIVAMMLNNRNMLGVSKKIIQGALLHDIGKDGIPNSVLNKHGRLNDDEFSIMKLHTTHGYSKLCKYGYPAVICDTALQHHEAEDGSGYPYGITGDQISYSAKLCHIADVYEAVCSSRVYKKAFERHRAKDIIKEDSKKFDPDVLELFLESVPLYFINDMIVYGQELFKVVAYTDGGEPIFRNITTLEEYRFSELNQNKIKSFDFNL